MPTCGRADLQRVGADRVGDVLQLRRPEISDGEIEPSLDLPVGILGKADRARRGDALQSRSDIDAVAHQVAVALFDGGSGSPGSSAASFGLDCSAGVSNWRTRAMLCARAPLANRPWGRMGWKRVGST